MPGTASRPIDLVTVARRRSRVSRAPNEFTESLLLTSTPEIKFSRRPAAPSSTPPPLAIAACSARRRAVSTARCQSNSTLVLYSAGLEHSSLRRPPAGNAGVVRRYGSIRDHPACAALHTGRDLRHQTIPIRPTTSRTTSSGRGQGSGRRRSISAPPAVVPGLSRWSTRPTTRASTSRSWCSTTTRPNDTPLRDIATVVGADYPDATVLVLSPSYVGSYSTHFPRASRWRAARTMPRPATRWSPRRTFCIELRRPEFPGPPSQSCADRGAGGGRRHPVHAAARQAVSNAQTRLTRPARRRRRQRA